MVRMEQFRMLTTGRMGVRIEQRVAQRWMQRLSAWEYGEGVLIVVGDDRWPSQITFDLTDSNMVRAFAGALYEMAHVIDGEQEGCEFQESV